MLNHYLDLHTEHTPEERCKELGAALAQNRKSHEQYTGLATGVICKAVIDMIM